MAQRSVAMLLSAPDRATDWRTTERRCEGCSAPFLPTRREQRFCPGGVCRVAWWAEHQRTEIHHCRCGRPCAGPDPQRCRRPDCKGTLAQDEDGGSVCLFCGQPGDELPSLRSVMRPARLRGSAASGGAREAEAPSELSP